MLVEVININNKFGSINRYINKLIKFKSISPDTKRVDLNKLIFDIFECSFGKVVNFSLGIDYARVSIECNDNNSRILTEFMNKFKDNLNLTNLTNTLRRNIRPDLEMIKGKSNLFILDLEVNSIYELINVPKTTNIKCVNLEVINCRAPNHWRLSCDYENILNNRLGFIIVDSKLTSINPLNSSNSIYRHNISIKEAFDEFIRLSK